MQTINIINVRVFVLCKIDESGLGFVSNVLESVYKG